MAIARREQTEAEIRAKIDEHLAGFNQTCWENHRLIAENLRKQRENGGHPVDEREQERVAGEWRRHFLWLYNRGIVPAHHLEIKDRRYVVRPGVDLYTVMQKSAPMGC